MVDARLRYLDRRTKPSGLILWYFRHPLVARTRVRGQPGEPAFHREYSRLLATKEKAAAQHVDPRSIGWLVDQYRSSDEWKALSEKSRRDYGRELDRLGGMAGDLPFASLTPAGVRGMRKQVKVDLVASRAVAIAERARRDEQAAAKAAEKGRAVRAPRRAQPKATDGGRTADYFKSVLSALFAWAIENEQAKVNSAADQEATPEGHVDGRTPWTEHQI